MGPRGGGAVIPASYSWLDHMPHLNHQQGGLFTTALSAWTPGRSSTDGTEFARGLVFDKSWFGHPERHGWQSIDIPLNANYDAFIGIVDARAERN